MLQKHQHKHLTITIGVNNENNKIETNNPLEIKISSCDK